MPMTFEPTIQVRLAPVKVTLNIGRVPQGLRGFDGGHTNYPPPEGVAELRQAVCAWYERDLDLAFPPDWVCVASGARPSAPLLYFGQRTSTFSTTIINNNAALYVRAPWV